MAAARRVSHSRKDRRSRPQKLATSRSDNGRSGSDTGAAQGARAEAGTVPGTITVRTVGAVSAVEQADAIAAKAATVAIRQGRIACLQFQEVFL